MLAELGFVKRPMWRRWQLQQLRRRLPLQSRSLARLFAAKAGSEHLPVGRRLAVGLGVRQQEAELARPSGLAQLAALALPLRAV